MANKSSANTYEDARKQRLLENKKDLRVYGKSFHIYAMQNRHVWPKPTNNYLIEQRRSSRACNPVPSYRDDVDVELPPLRKRSKFNSSWASYLARPVEEVRAPTYEERARAYKCAEKLQCNLQAGNPSFVKSMVGSHVYNCFCLGLPTKFCEDHLPKSTVDMVLEDEEGSDGGWRAFARDHKLDDGNALVFELIEPTRFKHLTQDKNDNVPVSEAGSDAEETPKETENRKKNDNHQLKNSTKSKNERSSQVSATRRSLRKR
ncbi:hypothetical protein Pfo_006864 [Paulownia fortunei]|nr:hypothetical protein Pfo_006864 [Paulownia fortunei]